MKSEFKAIRSDLDQVKQDVSVLKQDMAEVKGQLAGLGDSVDLIARQVATLVSRG